MAISTTTNQFTIPDMNDGNQATSRTTVLANGNILVTWSDMQQRSDDPGVGAPPSSGAVRAAIIDAKTGIISPSFLVNTVVAQTQSSSMVASDANGFLIVWDDTSTTPQGFSTDLKGQYYTNSGQRVGSEFQVTVERAGTQSGRSISTLEDGRFIVSWSDQRITNNQDIYARIVDPQNPANNSADILISGGALNQIDPYIITTSNGFAAAWIDPNKPGKIQFQTYTVAPGAKTVTAGTATDLTESGSPSNIRMDTLADGRIIVIWVETAGFPGDPSGLVVVGKIIDPITRVASNTFLVSDAAEPDSQYNVSVAALPNGGFVVSYTSGGADLDIKLKQFDSSGQALGRSITANDVTAGSQGIASVLLVDDDTLFVTWRHPTASAGTDVVGRFFTFDYLPSNTAPVVDANGTAAGGTGSVTYTENGGAIRIVASDASITDDGNITGMTLVLGSTPNGTDEVIVYRAALNGDNSLSALGLTGNYDAATKTFTISGTASAAVYQGVLRAMTYDNGSDAPNTTPRTVTISVTDAGGDVGQTTSIISVAAVNDAPIASSMSQSKAVTEGGSAINLDDIVVTDVDGIDTITATLTLSNSAAGALTTGTYGSATSTFNPGTGVWTVTGSVADVNAALAAVQFKPSADNDQNFTITTRIRDAANTGPADGTISIAVTAVNDAPTATNLTRTIAYNEDPGINVPLADIVVTDVDSGDTITATLTLSNSAAGALTTGTYGSATSTFNPGTGVWTVTGSVADVNAALAAVAFAPAANWNQSVTVATRIRDAAGTGPNDGTITLNATAINDAPVLADQDLSLTVLEDAGAPVDGAAGGTLASALLNGFSDVDGSALRGIAIVGADTASGTWWFSTDNGASWQALGTPSDSAARLLLETARIYFQPQSDYEGTISTGLTIRAWDASAGSNGGMANIAVVGTGGTTPFSMQTDTVRLTVTAINDAPVVTVPNNISVTEDQPTALTGVSFSDVDAGTGLVTATFSVPAGSLSASSGTGVTVGGNASTLTLTGTIADINAFIATGALIYTPVTNGTSTQVLTISISDGGNTGAGGSLNDTKTVDLTISQVNDAPVAIVPTSIAVTEDVPSALTGISFSDIDAGSSSVTVTLSVPVGVLSAVSGGGVTVGGTSSALTLTGSITNINAFIAASNVTYTPAANDTVTRVLTVTINDGGNTGAGGSQSDTETVGLEISPVNDSPVVTVPGSILVTEDTRTALTGITFSDVDAGSTVVTVTLSVPAGVLAATAAAGVLVGGTSSALILTGTVADINAFIASSNVTYTPVLNDTSTQVLTVVIDDGGNTGAGGSLSDTRTIDLNLTAVNDAPVVTVPVSVAVTENTPTALTGITFSDVDVGSALVTVTLSVPAGSLSATSGAGVIVGGTAAALTLVGTIAYINAFIAASGLTYTPALYDSGTKVLTVSIDDGGGSGSGGAQTDSDTVVLDIGAVNDAPVATVPANIAVTEDTATALTGISFSDVDAGSAPVTVTLSVPAGLLSATSGLGVMVGGTASVLTLTGTIADINAFIASNGVTYTPVANAVGPQVLTVSINDGGNTGSGGSLSDTETVNLNISPVNDVPVVTVPAGMTVMEDVAIALTGISFSDVDAASGLVTVTISIESGSLAAATNSGVLVGGNSSALTLTGTIANINAYIAASQVTFLSAANAHGDVKVTIGINDNGNVGAGGALLDEAEFTLSVTSVNDTPTIGQFLAELKINDTETGSPFPNVAISDVDGADTVLTATITLDKTETGSLSNLGSFVQDPDGRYMFTGTAAQLQAALRGIVFIPVENGGAPGQTVETTISLVVSDGDLSDGQSLTVVVQPVNDAPVAVDDGPVVVAENGAVAATALTGVLANDTDADRDVLSVSTASHGAAPGVPAGTAVTGIYGVLTLNADGSYAYVANTAAAKALGESVVGTDIFSYTVSDGQGGTQSANLTFEVTGVNDAAVFSGADTGAVVEDGTLVASGVLSVTDIDDGQSAFQAQADQRGAYGTFSFDASTGSWRYVLANDDSAVQSVGSGETRIEQFAVRSLDGTEQIIRITVGGADDIVLPVFTSGRDRFVDTDASSVMRGQRGNDTIYGAGGNDVLYGDSGRDWLDGGSGNDRLYGGTGHDTLLGGAGNDIIRGEAGKDWIRGGLGHDKMWGGAGADTFDFDTIKDSRVGAQRDIIYDFQTGVDRIDLRTIDANMGLKGNQAFTWTGTEIPFLHSGDGLGFLSAGFTGKAGQLRYVNGVLMGDVDGNGKSDFEIRIVGHFSAGDVLL